MNIGEEIQNVIQHVAYRSQLTISSEGSDPRKLIINPFSNEIEVMSKYIHEFLNKNVNNFQLQMADLSQPFNSCTILLYHTLLDVKKESSMGWYCDSKYSLSVKSKENSNGQAHNTVVVIFTVGSDRYVQWIMRTTTK